MAMTINTNIQSLNAQRNLGTSQSSLSTSMQRLSSGLRINSAKDDAAGLAIAERMTSQIRGLNQAQRNANDGVSLMQTAEGALGTIGNNLQRIRELAVQSSNATNSSTDRAALQKEVTQLKEEIDRVATTTSFNGTKLLDNSFNAQKFQVGANAGESITVNAIADARTTSLGSYRGVDTGALAVAASTAEASAAAAAKTIVVGGTTYNLGSIGNDAKAIASAINAQNIPGMKATASETSVASTATTTNTTGAGTASFVLNGTTINVNATTSAATNRASAMAEINKVSAATGVRAEDDGNGLKLLAADGRNIDVSAITLGTAVATTLSDFGLAAGTTAGKLSVAYDAPDAVNGSVSFTGFAAGSGFGTAKAIGTIGTSVAAVDISTADKAEVAIKSMDAALKSVNSARADLGAMQNRFESVVSNLNVNSENLSASKSRITDADFAAETANLSRSQILQQAGTAMVAQANQLPQGVLSLLR